MPKVNSSNQLRFDIFYRALCAITSEVKYEINEVKKS